MLFFRKRECSQSVSEPAGTYFQASHHLRSNHISVQEFILPVSEEHPLGSTVSDKCEIEGFAANGLLPGRLCWRQLQSQKTPELSEALPLFSVSGLFQILFRQSLVTSGCNGIKSRIPSGGRYTPDFLSD